MDSDKEFGCFNDMSRVQTGQNLEDLHVPCFCSQRWILAYASFLGFLCLYAVRFNLSVGIVCMVKTDVDNSSAVNSSKITFGACPGTGESAKVLNEHAEFDWDKETRSYILSSFFYGYIITQIPGGWLADRYGGRRILGIALFICGICTVLTPICARTSVILVYFVRVVLGLASGVCFPAMHSMWGRWAPTLERTKLIAMYSLGPTFGSVVTFAGSGYLCEYGFDNGWGSIFYVTGLMTLLWVLLWFIVTRDTPLDHPRITEAERTFINKNIEFDLAKKNIKVPWLAIFKSIPMYALLISQTCYLWMFYTILISIPDFMKSVLKFDIKSNGVLSSLPSLCFVITEFIAGQSADVLRSKRIMSTTCVRKIYQSSAFLGATLFIVLAGFTSCNRSLTVAYICLAMACAGLSRGGYMVNHVDFAAKYAGIIMGITNMFSNIPGLLTPVVAGKLTPHDTTEEWRNVFYVCAAFNIIGFLVFAIFGSGEVEEWAKDNKKTELLATKL